jgi:NTP pyrophosphatase (non-canonical NTP hydrolase)
MNVKDMQKRVIQNKINKGFDMTNVEKEFCLLYGEVGEAYEAFLKKKPDLGSELADVAIFLMSISEILKIDLEKEIINKMEVNEKRTYKTINGVLVKEQ